MFKNKLFFTTQHQIHSTLNLCTTQNSNPKSRLLDHTILVDLNNLWFTSNTASSVDHTIDLVSSKRPVLISVGPAHGINLFFNICAGTDSSSTGLGNRKFKTSLQSLVLVTYFVFFFFSSQFLQQENLPLTIKPPSLENLRRDWSRNPPVLFSSQRLCEATLEVTVFNRLRQNRNIFPSSSLSSASSSSNPATHFKASFLPSTSFLRAFSRSFILLPAGHASTFIFSLRTLLHSRISHFFETNIQLHLP